MTITKFNESILECDRRFSYQFDHVRYGIADSWRILDESGKGDCEDYALTVAWYYSDKSLWKLFNNFREGVLKLHYVHVNHVGHAVLEWNGKFVDNIQRRIVSQKYLEKRGYEFLIVMGVRLIVLNMLKGYTIGTLGRLKKIFTR